MTGRKILTLMFIVAAAMCWLETSASASSGGTTPLAHGSTETPFDPSARFSEEMACLALNIYFEARSEPLNGMLAVGHVVMNRVAARNFPDSVCAVIRQGGEVVRHKCQFSWWCDGRSDLPRNPVAWDAARLLAWFIYNGHTDDPTGGALWYHAEYVAPYWRDAYYRGPQIGRHIFYRVASNVTVSLVQSDG